MLTNSQGQPTLPTANTPLEAARNGFEFYKPLQAHDGHWPGEYGGPMFLIPGLVIGSYVTGMPFAQEERLEIIRYLINQAKPDTGGWGMYVLSHSSCLDTEDALATLKDLLLCSEPH